MITKMKKLSVAASLACIFSLASLQAAFAVDIPNVRVTDVSSQFGSTERVSANVVNGSGLSGGIHTTGPVYEWLANGDTTPQITFQLPQNYNVSNIHIWNINEGTGTRGANSVDIYTSASDVGAVSNFVGNFTFNSSGGGATAGFDLTSPASGPAWTPQANVRRILFDVLTNHGDGFASGLAEVRFQTNSALPTAPTPNNLIAGVTATASSEFPSRTAASTTNGSGLSGAFPNEVHANNPEPNQMWRNGDSEQGQQSTITYNLQVPTNLGGIKIWDYVEGNNTDAEVNKATQINVQVSADNSTYSDLGDFTLPGRNPEVDSAATTHPGNFLDLSTATNLNLLNNIQYVRFKVLSTQADRPNGDTEIRNQNNNLQFLGIAEVQFFDAVVENNAVPEPSTYALGLIGLAGLGLFAWRQRRCG